MLRAFWAVLLLIIGTIRAAADVAFEGQIGPFEIQLELEAREDARVSGRYRYAGRTDWLDLNGQVFDHDAIEIVERAEGKETGRFYLNVGAQDLTGFWAAGETHHPVVLRPVIGAVSELLPQLEREEINAGLTGRYSVGGHWVNEWFAPNYELSLIHI